MDHCEKIVMSLRHCSMSGIGCEGCPCEFPLGNKQCKAVFKIAADRIEASEALMTANESGRLILLPAAIGQNIYVPSGDGGIYTARVKEIAIYRVNAHDAVLTAVVDGCVSPTEYLIAQENKGTHWFETQAEAYAATNAAGGPDGTA